jgi:Flp pilus assembly protein TadG
MIRQNREAGVALVEFALSIVLVLTIIFGIIDVGRAIFAYVWVANTARIGARYAMVTGAFCLYPDGRSCGATGAQLITYLENNSNGINFSTNNCSGIGSGTRGAVCIQSGCISATAAANLPCASGVPAAVQVQYQFGFICPFLPLPTWTMTSTSARIVQ